jgi:hypothetical protein
MSIFDTEGVIKKEVEVDDNDRTGMLLDYSFNFFCDLYLTNLDINPYLDLQEFFTVQWDIFFEALNNACPLWWFPDCFAPYEIIFKNSLTFKDDGEYILITLEYHPQQDEITGIKTRTFIFNKDWL